MNSHDEANAVGRSWLAGRLTRRQALGRLVAIGFTIPSASAFLAACSGGSTSQSQGSTRSKITIGFVQEPTVLDPTVDATASIATILRDNVYEGLVRLDQNLRLVPALAKSWDVSSDGRAVTFHLNQGVQFHDGSPLTAQDVKFSWDRAKDPNTSPVNPHLDYFAPVDRIDVADDHTVKVTLKQYSDSWLFHMSAGSASIVSSKTVAQNPTSPVGSGPFKFAGWNKGATLSLTRNDGYWGQKARLKDAVFRFIADANAMNNALLAGDIDAIGQVGGPEQVANFKSNSSYKVLEGTPVGKVIVAMNNTKGALKDPRVRRAISMAIDRKAWIDGIQAGYAVPIGSHAVPNQGEPYYVDETSVNPHDPQKAKQLLQDSGHAAGLTLRLAQISAFPYAVRGTDILLSELKDVGMTVAVDQMDFNRWLAEVFKPGGPQDYDLTIINHVEERDIANYANPKYYWHYQNDQVTQWLGQADAEPDQAKRNDIYAKVQKQLAEDAANAYVMSPRALVVTRSAVQGFPNSPTSSTLYLRDVYFS